MAEFEVQRFLPHRPPAVLLDRVLEIFEEGICVQTALPAGQASPFLFIEAAAQAVAAHKGHSQAQKSEPPRAGFLAAVRDFKFFTADFSPRVLQIQVIQVKNLNPFYLCEARVRDGETLLAQGMIILFEVPGADHAPAV